ncbi:pseudouridine synthase [Daldinia caldariorum]|uniref:pseudouridine synthase n=1 Tax=Daldinia caldariorum TaxID=326644 RepID=UPI00200841C7|nr:pseudouridine synthase [Daldinia caldariorum]KAI1471323.1 pseudouridine synthase [Daldinia caldariorum]
MDERDPTYNKWTKDALIRRIQYLEANLRDGGHKSEPAQGSTTATSADGDAANPPKKKKVPGKIDPSKYATRLVAFKLAYLGKRYGGFEYAAHANQPTIEEELWKAFVKTCLIFPEKPDEVNWDSIEYSKCGRTDRGVSAFGQVIAVRVRSNRPLPKEEQPAEASQGDENIEVAAEPGVEADEVEEKREFDDFTDEIQYCRLLNRILPPDIRMLAWCPTTPEDFSARHDCCERQYRYFFTQPAFAPIPQSLENPANTSQKLKAGWLDIEAMRKAAKKFEGLHDFRNFSKIDPSKINVKFQRRIFESDIVEVKDAGAALPFLDSEEYRPAGLDLQEKLPKVYYFHVRGTAFLWHQIRCMAAIVFSVGQRLEDPSIVDKLLDFEAEPRRPNYQLADDVPLVLWDCKFPRPEKPENALKWVYVGEDNPLNQHGSHGLMSSMWEYWRERKLDELLAGQLLNVISSQADISLRKDSKAPLHVPATVKAFEGGNKERLAGRYQPVLQKPRGGSAEEVFDREARRKGYANAAEWREVLLKKKQEAGADDLEEGTE